MHWARVSLAAGSAEDPTIDLDNRDVTIENCVIGLRIRASRGIAILGCYFEPGQPEAGTRRRRALDIDAETMDLTFVGARFSEPLVPAGEENWTPTYVALPPESRGVVDASMAPASGHSYLVNGYGGGLSGTIAAHANRIRNADMSRGTMFWPNSPLPPIVTPFQAPFVTGGASTRLRVAASSTEHIYQDFVLDAGLRTVTVCVRYRLVSAGAHAFRFDLFDPVSGTRLGFFSDVGPGPTTEWRVRSLTGRFDGLAGGVVGPRTLRVRVFPYNGPPPLTGQEVLLDSVWLIDGEYASTCRPYSEGAEILVGDDREVSFGGTTNAAVGPTAAAPNLVPSNAVGMVVEMLVQGSAATANTTILRVNDLSGTLTTRDVHAFVSGRPTIIEYTLPFAAGALPQWSVLGASGANTVVYSVRLKQWILRL